MAGPAPRRSPFGTAPRLTQPSAATRPISTKPVRAQAGRVPPPDDVPGGVGRSHDDVGGDTDRHRRGRGQAPSTQCRRVAITDSDSASSVKHGGARGQGEVDVVDDLQRNSPRDGQGHDAGQQDARRDHPTERRAEHRQGEEGDHGEARLRPPGGLPGVVGHAEEHANALGGHDRREGHERERCDPREVALVGAGEIRLGTPGRTHQLLIACHQDPTPLPSGIDGWVASGGAQPTPVGATSLGAGRSELCGARCRRTTLTIRTTAPPTTERNPSSIRTREVVSPIPRGADCHRQPTGVARLVGRRGGHPEAKHARDGRTDRGENGRPSRSPDVVW